MRSMNGVSRCDKSLLTLLYDLISCDVLQYGDEEHERSFKVR